MELANKDRGADDSPGPRRHDRGMDLPAPLAWLVDEACASAAPELFLAELGGRLLKHDCIRLKRILHSLSSWRTLLG